MGVGRARWRWRSLPSHNASPPAPSRKPSTGCWRRAELAEAPVVGCRELASLTGASSRRTRASGPPARLSDIRSQRSSAKRTDRQLRAAARHPRKETVMARTRDQAARHAGARALGAGSLGAVAIGALALGAGAIGALAIGRLSVRRGAIHSLKVDELKVGRLHVEELAVTRASIPPSQAR